MTFKLDASQLLRIYNILVEDREPRDDISMEVALMRVLLLNVTKETGEGLREELFHQEGERVRWRAYLKGLFEDARVYDTIMETQRLLGTRLTKAVAMALLCQAKADFHVTHYEECGGAEVVASIGRDSQRGFVTARGHVMDVSQHLWPGDFR